MVGPVKDNIYAPNFEKVGDILVWLVRMCVCIHVRDIILKLHVWIPHGKIADAYFWFSLNYLPLSNYGPLTNKGMKFCKCRISKSIIARNLKLVRPKKINVLFLETSEYFLGSVGRQIFFILRLFFTLEKHENH